MNAVFDLLMKMLLGLALGLALGAVIWWVFLWLASTSWGFFAVGGIAASFGFWGGLFRDFRRSWKSERNG